MYAAAAKRTALAAVSVLVLVAMSILVPAGGASSDGRDRESPTKPHNVRVTSATQSLVRVAWDPSTDNVGVEGYYVFGDKGKATVDAPEHVDAPEYSVTALACGQSAEIGVVAYDGSRNRSEKAEATVSTAPCLDTQPPSAPSNFRQVATTQDAVVLAWSASWDDVGVVEYGVYRNLLRVAAPAEPTLALAGLLCGSTYDYTVDALDAAGNRSPRATVFVRTAPCPVSLPSSDTTPPSQPTGLAASNRTQTSLSLSWNASTDNVAVTGYDVHRNGTKMATMTSTSASQTGLVCGTSYTFAVVARDAAGNSSSQAQLAAATTACSTPTPPPPGDSTPPSQPTALAASNRTQTSLSLSWNASTDNVAVTGYDVHRNGTKMATMTSTSASQTGLVCGTSYTFAVVARDAAGNSSSQAQLAAATTACSTPTPPPPGDSTPPSQPTGLAASNRTQTSLSLSWNASTDNVAVTGYDVHRNGTKMATMTSTSASQTGLVCGTSYTFAVVARDAAGNSSSQAQLAAATTACSTPTPPPGDSTPPSQPTALAASNRTQTSLSLSWNASTDNVAVTGYDVHRNGTKMATMTSTSASQTGLVCGTSYTFAVVARDAAGNSSSQAQLTAATTACSTPTPTPPPPPPGDTTPPSQPSNLAITSASRTSVSLAWSSSTDNVGVAGYQTYVDGSSASVTLQPGDTRSNLDCGTAYTFEVDAFDTEGNYSTKAAVTGSTAACADTQPPSAPSDLVATSRTATSIALSWSASSDNVGVAGYALYRGGAQVGTSSGNTGIFSGLSCNTNYTLAVDAYDAASNHSSKVTVMVSTTACPDTTPPSAPSGVAASNVTGTSLTLSWNASTDNVGVTGYDVHKNGATVTNVSSTSSAQTGLVCGTSYAFGVVARDAAGNSSPTASMNVSTSACPPLATPTWTSSVADGQTVQAGTTWIVAVNPAPASVELWATPSGGTSLMLENDATVPYDAALNLTPGNYLLGACAWYGSARTCFDDRKNVTIAATSSSPALSGSAPYSVENFNLISPLLWTSIQTTAGSVAPAAAGQAQDASGRLSFGAAPDGNGRAARFEIRDSDPGWPNDPTVDRTQLAASTQATWNKSAVAVGDIRWFDIEFYLPNDFDFARNPGWNSYVGLHPGSATGWGCFNISIDYQSDPAYMTFKVAGGSPVGTTANLKYINLFQVTNADRTPYSPNRNRRIRVVYGARFAPDNTGWLEIWVDGVNILPRTNRPTMWAGDTGSYLKIGPYKSASNPIPSGKTVLYITKLAISNQKPT